ncbi:60S acidic ribosomal protein P0 [Vulpes lagopus]
MEPTQVQQIHAALGGKAGRLRAKNPGGGLCVTKEGPAEVGDALLATEALAALVLGPAPLQVTVSAQGTGLGPGKTSCLQALGVSIRIPGHHHEAGSRPRPDAKWGPAKPHCWAPAFCPGLRADHPQVVDSGSISRPEASPGGCRVLACLWGMKPPSLAEEVKARLAEPSAPVAAAPVVVDPARVKTKGGCGAQSDRVTSQISETRKQRPFPSQGSEQRLLMVRDRRMG